MSATKTVLAASAVLTTLGLAGCQTTEERVYYPGAPVYDETVVVAPRAYPPPPPRVVVVRPPPRYVVGGPIVVEPPAGPRPPRERYHPRPPRREPPAGGQPRWQGGPEPAPPYMKPPGR